jgi:diacylglycerol kinase family enzyme
VIGGTALGAAVAWLGTALVKPRPAPAQHVRQGGVPITLPPVGDGADAFIVVNPSSGTSTISLDPQRQIEQRLPAARVHELQEGDDLPSVVRDAVASARPAVLGVCGGDGTVSAVAALAREFDLPLLVIPGGTFNHFAGTAGVASVAEAIDAAKAGEGVQADVAELVIEGQPPVTVLNAASVGLYPDFVKRRDKHEEKLGKWVAGVIAAVRVLREAKPVHVTVDGRAATVLSLFIGVNRNRPGSVAPLQRLRLDDGQLDVRILHTGPRPRTISSLVFGSRAASFLRKRRLLWGAPVIQSFATGDLSVVVRRRGESAGVGHDGELMPGTGEYRFRIRNVPGGLRVYSPRVT